MKPNSNSAKQYVLSSLFWAFLERCSAQGVGLIVNIILARLLLPEDYGVLAIMVIFTNLANQFVQNGFAVSLIQGKNVSEDDYSSVLYVSLIITVILYIIIFLFAPLIGSYYRTPSLVWPLRTLALLLFPSTLQSVQTAKLRREMDFRQIFYLTIFSSLSSGIVGILIAFANLGVWALVAQQICGAVSTCIVLWFKLGWRPHAVINWRRVGILFRYGWKILASSLLNTLYNDLTGLIIGKKYTTSALAYYDKGQMLPQKLIINISDSMQNVMLPALSREQENREHCKMMMRRSVQVSSFILFPMMAGLAAIATPLVTILLTEKWLPCVPFMQLACVLNASNAISSANLQAMKAMGRSDMFLKLELIKKTIGLLVLAVTVIYFNSAIAIMWGTTLWMPLGLFINAAPNKKIIGYSFFEQLRDIFPPLLLSFIMCMIVLRIEAFFESVWAALIFQILAGVAIYASGAVLFKLEAFNYVFNIIGPYINKLKQKFYRFK